MRWNRERAETAGKLRQERKLILLREKGETLVRHHGRPIEGRSEGSEEQRDLNFPSQE